MTSRPLDLAPIGNCAVASLVDGQGRHVWFCFPRLDADPVFNALANGAEPEAGFMDVVLENPATARQAYRRNTAVLETILTDSQGNTTRLIDFAPRFTRFGRSFRPPMLVRRIEPISGRSRVTIRVRPTFGYGALKPQISVGSNHARFIGPDEVLRITADIGPSFILQENSFLLDRPITIFLGPDESIAERPDGLGDQFLRETTSYWTGWVQNLAVPFDWQDAVIRSAIALKLCSFEETGAIVAALTTSIPEAPNSARNWDYRYCWLRDAFFTVSALNHLGASHTMESFVRYVLDAALDTRADEIRPLYPIIRGTDLTEREAAALRGYAGMGPVRVGNAAAAQRQGDVFGSIILSAAQMFWDARLASPGDVDLFQRLCAIGEAAHRHALAPDSGLWEYRGRQRPHTYSVAMSWAALHRLSLIAARVGRDDEAALWQARASALKAELLRRATTPEGWLSGVLDAAVADGSTLLLPELGVLDYRDERYLRTLGVVESRLMRNGFMLRYDEADDFGAPETAFLVCTLWYVDALASVGRREEAVELFSRVLACRNHVGLLSEDVEPRTGTLWGNFPQTYSMVGLVLSASRLSRSWEAGLWRVS